MLNEVKEYLSPNKGDIAFDCTIGCGGHARHILDLVKPTGRLIGIDCDLAALECAKDKLNNTYQKNLILIHDNFKNIKNIALKLKIDKVDIILFDLGVSSIQLDDEKRGFSFRHDAPLDMRMDRRSEITAFDLVNNLTEHEIANILYEYGNERFSRRIARRIVETRKTRSIRTTKELSDIIMRSMPRGRSYTKINPATRSFQALRIAVNQELENIQLALDDAIELLAPGGRISIISFHSLEDGLAKRTLKKAKTEGKIKLLFPKPLRPERAEILANPRARSACLRSAMRLK